MPAGALLAALLAMFAVGLRFTSPIPAGCHSSHSSCSQAYGTSYNYWHFQSIKFLRYCASLPKRKGGEQDQAKEIDKQEQRNTNN